MMRSKGWRIIFISAMGFLIIGVVSCETILRNVSPVSPTASEATAVQPAMPYPPTATTSPYPQNTQFPGTPRSLSISETPTPNELATNAAQTTIDLTATHIFSLATLINTPDVPVAPKHELQFSFVDRYHGWVMGYTEWGEGIIPAIASTKDGGKTWQALPIPPINWGYRSPFFWDYDNFLGLLFTSPANGWLHQKKLFVTHDGGQTWSEEHPRGLIIQMGKSNEGFYWALEQVGSNLTLWKAVGTTYDQWTKIIDNFPMTMDHMHVSLAVINSQHAWISSWISFLLDRPDFGTKLFVTRDGGNTWEAVIPPKPCDFYPLIISPVSIQELWMGCGFPAGAGSGITAVYESSDGGTSWSEMKSDTVGYFFDLNAVSKSFVYMTYAQIITFTYDGGKTWKDAQVSCPLNSQAAYFIDESHGWAACDSSINRTVDGGRSWECVDLPGSKVCPP